MASAAALDGMAVVADMLRARGAFTIFTQSPRKRRDGLPVVVRGQSSIYDDASPLSLSLLTASFTSHAVELEADLDQVAFPGRVSPEARFVPARWLTINLTGDEADLRKLPPGPREERSPDTIRWTFTGDEVDAGDVSELFGKTAAALCTASGQYR